MTPGWDPDRIARAWVVLMNRLGYKKFVAQGGDWGALITDLMGVLAPPELLAIHTNMPGAVPNDINAAAFTGAPAPSGLGRAQACEGPQAPHSGGHLRAADRMQSGASRHL
jgi:hypothetical protein